MKNYVVKRIKKGGICDYFYLYEDNTVYETKQTLVSITAINKSKSDEEVLETILNTFSNGTEANIKIIN